MNNAIESFQQGNTEEALQFCKQFLEANPNHPEALNLMGAIAFKNHAFEESVEYIQQAMQHNPSMAPHYAANLALAYVHLGNIAAAASTYRTAAETLHGRSQVPEALNCFEKAAYLLRDFGHFEEAKRLYHRILQIDPKHLPSYNDLGLIAQQEHNLDESVTFFKRALTIDPEHSFAYNNLGTTFQMQNKSQEAITVFEKALSLDPHCAEAHINLATLHREANNFKEATHHGQKALDLLPDHPGVYTTIGTIYHAQGKLDEAIHHYQKALEVDPTFIQAEQNLYMAKQHQAQMSKSVTTLL